MFFAAAYAIHDDVTLFRSMAMPPPMLERHMLPMSLPRHAMLPSADATLFAFSIRCRRLMPLRL